ncbi:hypothetical protein BV20DRAFT_963731 [Pilatotrama ljubarskyi]|nr:hypothetical protein BV20DRAFT_963731 [Pilatotrama ljubarskyi]
MSDQSQYGFLPQPDAKRRKLDGEATESAQSKGDRTKGAADKAKANYVRNSNGHFLVYPVHDHFQLSGQLRLRLQYAKLKVEHGWQRQSLSEVENLYFRHTHLTRPYPVISPGGRRSSRTPSSNGVLASNAAHQALAMSQPGPSHDPGFAPSQNGTMFASGTGSSVRSHGTLASTSSDPSLGTANPYIPSTPDIDGGRIATPHAPHLGSGSGITRYPVSRSDSTATVIIDNAPSLSRVPLAKPGPTHTQHGSPSSAPSSSQLSGGGSAATSSFREPFDPMEPTEHIDSQLAALRSMMSTSSASKAQATPAPSLLPNACPDGGGLTYDSFWSSHSLATSSYRASLATQTHVHAAGQSRSTAPLQAHASAPALLAPSSSNPGVGQGSTIARGQP